MPVRVFLLMLIRTIAFITDSHIDHPVSKEKGVNTHRNWELIAESIKAHAVDFVVFGGDIGDSKILDFQILTFSIFFWIHPEPMSANFN